MGQAKNLWMEQQETDYEEQKEAWIREQIGDGDADEDHPDWAGLAQVFDTGGIYDWSKKYSASGDDWDVYGKTRIEIFDTSIAAVQELLNTQSLTFQTARIHHVMLHAHLVASVEAYLSSTFIEQVMNNGNLMKKLVETDPEFGKRQFSLSTIYSRRAALKSDVQAYLRELIFHNLAKVTQMYLAVLGIDLGKVAWLYKAIDLRHHCVHRAGYDKDGSEIALDRTSVLNLLGECRVLIHGVESLIERLPPEQEVDFL